MGPSVFDRVLAANMIGTKMVLLIAVLGYLRGRPDFMDIALAYAMINFIGTMAVLKFFRGRPHRQPFDAGRGTAATRSGIE
ncbi:MAG: MrpF/PhaF family protein [Alphaproteobacteria bacterium]